VYGVQVDLENSVYAMGQSLGGAFPVTTGVYSNPNSSQFIIKMDSMLSTNVYSTVFGSGNPNQTNISPVAFLVDTCQNVYISGWGGDLDIPSIPSSVGTTTGMPVTASAIPAGSVLSATTDGYDFYFMALSKNATSLLFGAFYGRSSTTAFHGEHVDGGTSRFDKQGVVYQAICGGCGGTTGPALPTTSGSYSPTNGSSNCNLASLKIAFQLGAPDAIANASPKTRGCPPLTVQFVNTSTNAISYQWNFRDGSPLDTAFQPKHTFNNPGTYNVQLVVYNPNACKVRDTTLVTIIVDSNRIKSDFNFAVTDSCGPFRAAFTNTSIYSALPGAQARTTFTWYFGDGATFSGANPGNHDYPSTGTYTVMLIMSDVDACNTPDTIKKIVTINSSRVAAIFNSPDSVCLRSGIVFTNLSTNATRFTWYFGDGDTSITSPVTHTYKGDGTYELKLVAYNPFTCNKTDTLKKTIRIKKLPTADFSHAPLIPESNKPVQFTNKSSNADIYSWNYGDGSPRSSEVNPSHLFRKTGTFLVCLRATSNEGCSDTVCKKVDADIHTALDLPTGFSPNGDGSNDILYVRGGGIEVMNLKIFNRWGEKVFESSSLGQGWDGTFKGKPQEVDAYAFVLTATFIDGSSATKKGNVTLLR
jgi:gliding motility-associated-like protein